MSTRTKTILAIAVLLVVGPPFPMIWASHSTGITAQANVSIGAAGVACQLAAIAVFITTFRAAART